MVRSFVAAVCPEFVRPYGRPSDSFSSLWAAFTLTVHIKALYNESVGEVGHSRTPRHDRTPYYWRQRVISGLETVSQGGP